MKEKVRMSYVLSGSIKKYRCHTCSFDTGGQVSTVKHLIHAHGMPLPKAIEFMNRKTKLTVR